jgi:KipI family sensor histidine kinase inhibitor
MKGRLQFSNYNDHFVLITSGEGQNLTVLGRDIYEGQFSFIEDVIATPKEVCLKLNRPFQKEDEEVIASLIHAPAQKRRTFTLPVCFEMGEDWALVEEALVRPKSELVDGLDGRVLQLSMLGFLPGFLYLVGLKEDYQVPRKSTPSKYVEAGTVALGGKYLGVYSIESPGGWYRIGRTPLRIFEKSDPPLTLQPDDFVKIKNIDEEAFSMLLSEDISLEEYNLREDG